MLRQGCYDFEFFRHCGEDFLAKHYTTTSANVEFTAFVIENGYSKLASKLDKNLIFIGFLESVKYKIKEAWVHCPKFKEMFHVFSEKLNIADNNAFQKILAAKTLLLGNIRETAVGLDPEIVQIASLYLYSTNQKLARELVALTERDSLDKFVCSGEYKGAERFDNLSGTTLVWAFNTYGCSNELLRTCFKNLEVFNEFSVFLPRKAAEIVYKDLINKDFQFFHSSSHEVLACLSLDYVFDVDASIKIFEHLKLNCPERIDELDFFVKSVYEREILKLERLKTLIKES